MDNSATTAIHPEVLEAMLPYLQEEYGNPSSKYYTLAENAKKAVEEARQQVATLLRCNIDEIIFTSGATESNNMILKGVSEYYGSKGASIVTSLVEHPSVLDTCAYLESKNIKVSYLKVDNFGRVKLDDIKKELISSPTLLSIIWGNNEVGSINPVSEISNLCHLQDTFLHTDATQVIGKAEINLKELPGIRFLSLSGHKLHAPKGIGVAFIRKQTNDIYTKITPLLHGGGQENNYRSGTLSVHNIIGLGKAAELATLNMKSTGLKLKELELKLMEILNAKFGEKIKFNHDNNNKIPGILSVQFVGLNNELLLKKLAPYLAISSGSACSSSKPSHVLSAMGLTLNEIRQTIRISLSNINTFDDITFFNNL